MAAKSQMQLACEEIVKVFHHYAECTNKEKDDVLDKEEFKKMIEKEFPDCLKNVHTQEGVHKLFQELDKDENKKIDFAEFMTLLGKYIPCIHEKSHAHEEGHQPHGHPHGHPHSHPHGH